MRERDAARRERQNTRVNSTVHTDGRKADAAGQRWDTSVGRIDVDVDVDVDGIGAIACVQSAMLTAEPRRLPAWSLGAGHEAAATLTAESASPQRLALQLVPASARRLADSRSARSPNVAESESCVGLFVAGCEASSALGE